MPTLESLSILPQPTLINLLTLLALLTASIIHLLLPFLTTTPIHKMEAIRAINAHFKATPLSQNLVGLFIGATSGLGEHTLKAFAASTNSPRIYFVGRNVEAGERITRETLAINPSATVTFLPVNSLDTIASTQPIVQEITRREEKLDVLVMSQGYLTMKGRDEQAEGLDRKMVVQYYGRMKFLTDLLPLLNRAATLNSTSTATTTPGFTPQVINIFGASRENAPAITSLLKANNLDLSLPNTFSGLQCEAVTVTSTSLIMEHLSLLSSSSNIRFQHIQPGVVADTNAARDLPTWAKCGLHIFAPIAGLYFGSEKGVNVGQGIAALMFKDQGKSHAAAGAAGGNLFIGGWKGDSMDWRDLKGKYAPSGKKDQGKWDEERKDMRGKVWEFLRGVFERAGTVNNTATAQAAPPS